MNIYNYCREQLLAENNPDTKTFRENQISSIFSTAKEDFNENSKYFQKLVMQ